MESVAINEPALKLSIKSEKDVTIEEVVKEANKIWKFAKARKLKIEDTKKTGELLEEVRKKYPSFCQAYPIVSRYICQFQEYSPKVFRLWLMKIKEHPWKSPEEYMDAQADYVTKLFCARKPRANKTEINNVRSNIRTILLNEYNQFKACAETNDAVVTKNETRLHNKNADELFRFSKIAGTDGMGKAEVIRFEADVDLGEISNKKIDDIIADRMNAEPCHEKLAVNSLDLLT